MSSTVTIAYVSMLIGVIIGYMISKWNQFRKPCDGILKLDVSDPDGPYLFLELSQKDLAEITTKKEVKLQVQLLTQK